MNMVFSWQWNYWRIVMVPRCLIFVIFTHDPTIMISLNICNQSSLLNPELSSDSFTQACVGPLKWKSENTKLQQVMELAGKTPFRKILLLSVVLQKFRTIKRWTEIKPKYKTNTRRMRNKARKEAMPMVAWYLYLCTTERKKNIWISKKVS